MFELFNDFSGAIQLLTGSPPDKATSRILQEAAVFLPISDGQKPMTVAEGSEYLVSVLSGFRAGSIAYNDLSDSCKKAGMTTCDFRQMPSAIAFSHLPQLASRMTPGLWQSLEPLLEQAVAKGKTGPLQVGDLVKMWIELQYIEAFYQRYDVDHDALISKEESLVAFTIYGPTIGDLLKGFDLGDDERRAFFTYLFKYGQTPFDEFAGSLKFLTWLWHENTWDYHADRTRLAEILAKLAAF